MHTNTFRFAHILIRGCVAALVAALCSISVGCKATTDTVATTTGINKINHVIVVYMENHSFDNLYGEFPGANGLSNATASHYMQIDTATGQPYSTLPWSDPNFSPQNLPNKPFLIDSLRAPNLATRDLVHKYYQEIQQIDGGKMDKFVPYSDAKGLSMGHYRTAALPMYAIAQQYTLCDNFFHSAFGGSFLNHIYMIAADAPRFPNAPSNLIAKGVNADGSISDGPVSPDGYGINTLQPTPNPYFANTPAANRLPLQTILTIGDRMNDKGVSWAWYSGKWNLIQSGNATHTDSSLFQFHHQPFNYFKNFGGAPDSIRKKYLKDEDDFNTALAAGTLPAVSFLKPYGIDNEHPGYTDLMTGDNYLVGLINRIKSSPIWKDCVVIVTYDEHGGYWDHVAPPAGDKWGPGSRVPGIIISPFSKPGIDHTQYETVSILAFIEKRWGLTPLGTRDAAANPFTNALQF